MLSFFTLKKQLNFVKNMNYNIQYSLLIVAFLFIQCADSSPTGPTLDLDPVLLEKTKIVFDSRSNGAPIDDIYTVSPDGSNLLNISNTAQYVEWVPRWSPDGSRIIFQSVKTLSSSGVGPLLNHKDENIGIVSMAADGSDPVNITRHPEGDFCPSWSPNGSKIAFISRRDGTDRIYIMNADGANQFKITNNSFSIRSLEWSPVIN